MTTHRKPLWLVIGETSENGYDVETWPVAGACTREGAKGLAAQATAEAEALGALIAAWCDRNCEGSKPRIGHPVDPYGAMGQRDFGSLPNYSIRESWMLSNA